MRREDVKSLYYITHKDNAESILENGILSHQKIKDSGIQAKIIYDESVINTRENKTLPNGNSLFDYANLYFQPRNPMLYRVLHYQGQSDFSKGTTDIILLEIKKDILDTSQDKFIATANAASHQAEFYDDINKGLKKINKIILNDNAWRNYLSDGKAKFMAEFLCQDRIPPEHIISIYTANEEIKKELEKIRLGKVNVILDKVKFFLPN